jgi:hypothetical protein
LSVGTKFHVVLHVSLADLTILIPKFRSKAVKALLNFVLSLDSSVHIVTGYGLDDPGFIPENATFFSSPQLPDRLWGPPSLLSERYFSLGVMRQGREADHSPPSTSEVNSDGAIPPLPNMSSWHSA